jgi:hypothetical protein
MTRECKKNNKSKSKMTSEKQVNFYCLHFIYINLCAISVCHTINKTFLCEPMTLLACDEIATAVKFG